jgi:peptide/nickel transport system permease protein
MIRAIAYRLVQLVATLAVASLVVFAALAVLPGDPASLMLGLGAEPETLAALRRELGLDQPLAVRYADWIAGLLTGDLGKSTTYGVPVTALLTERAVVSLPLAAIALLLSTAIAIPVGVFAASRHGGAVDAGIMGASQIGLAIPNFWFGILLVYVFAISLGMLPAGGFPGWDEGILGSLKALILPAVALALPQAAILARIMRSALIDVLDEDFIRTARAKGLPREVVVWRHGVRNALIPVLTILGLQFSFLIAGTIIIENVFYLPGLGRLVFQAINQRDLIVVQNVVLLLVAAVVIVNFLVDVAYVIVDPRLRKS